MASSQVKAKFQKESPNKSRSSQPNTKSKLVLGDRALTKVELLKHLADSTGLTKKEVQAVLQCLTETMIVHLKKLGVFSLSGLFKMLCVKKPATKARQGVNPFTGEPAVFKAKPASRKLKIRPLKTLKQSVGAT